jgi:hypothetical protein
MVKGKKKGGGGDEVKECAYRDSYLIDRPIRTPHSHNRQREPNPKSNPKPNPKRHAPAAPSACPAAAKWPRRPWSPSAAWPGGPPPQSCRAGPARACAAGAVRPRPRAGRAAGPRRARWRGGRGRSLCVFCLSLSVVVVGYRRLDSGGREPIKARTRVARRTGQAINHHQATTTLNTSNTYPAPAASCPSGPSRRRRGGDGAPGTAVWRPRPPASQPCTSTPPRGPPRRPWCSWWRERVASDGMWMDGWMDGWMGQADGRAKESIDCSLSV